MDWLLCNSRYPQLWICQSTMKWIHQLSHFFHWVFDNLTARFVGFLNGLLLKTLTSFSIPGTLKELIICIKVKNGCPWIVCILVWSIVNINIVPPINMLLFLIFIVQFQVLQSVLMFFHFIDNKYINSLIKI